MDKFCEAFEAAIPDLKKEILAEFELQQIPYRLASHWEEFERVIIPVLKRFLQRPPFNISEDAFTKAKTKNDYPDLKVRVDNKIYAIDVKSGEDKKSPEYDMGRLLNYESERFEKFAEDYIVTVRWKKDDNEKYLRIVNVYIEQAIYSAGQMSKAHKGVKYRKKDGNIRPKSWKDFASGQSFWKTRNEFINGLQVSRDFLRQEAEKSFEEADNWREWLRKLSSSERQLVQDYLYQLEVETKNDIDEA